MTYLEILKIFTKLIKSTDVQKKLIFASGILIGLASLFQMAGLGLVVPVLNALVDETHFKGILTAPVLGTFLKSLPITLSNHNIFISIIALIFLAIVAENVFILLGRYCALALERDLTTELRVKIFNKFINFHKGFFAKQEANEINAILINFINSASRTSTNLTLLFTQATFALIFVVLMFLISVELTLLSLVLLPIIHFLANSFTKKIKKSAELARNELLRMTNHADDIFNNIPLVQLSVSEEKEKGKFAKNVSEVSHHVATTRFKGYCVPAAVDILNGAGALVIVAASVFLFFTFNSYSLGRMLVFFVALRRFISNTQQFTSTLVQASAELPYLITIEEALELPDPVDIKSGDTKFQGIKKQIKFKNVSFAYQSSEEVLKEISFDVPVNSLIAIVGPSGAGKTTLINLLPRFYDPSSGQIEIDGMNLKDFELASLRQKISIVSQSTFLFNKSIKENIVYGLSNVGGDDFNRALELAQFRDFVETLPDKENTLVGNRGSKLSGGEVQRLCIARAILADPNILILDEPTSALDAMTEQRLDRAMEAVIKDRTTFVIAHRLITVKKADKIIFIDNGTVEESGTFDQLIKNKKSFYEFCKLQNLFRDE